MTEISTADDSRTPGSPDFRIEFKALSHRGESIHSGSICSCVDPNQPQTILDVPDAEVIIAIQELWREAKKPADLVVAMDTSGSMEGDKISSARTSPMQFIDNVDDRDHVELLIFNANVVTLSQLSPLGEKRQEVIT